MEKMYGDLFTAMKKAKVETGQPLCLFPSYSETSMDMICALPVDARAKVPTKYKIEQNEGGKAVKAIHQGDYKDLIITHEQINKFMEFKKLELSGAPWEVYVTDPTLEKDTAKWVTEVYYPVKSL
jgi:effector-binding domain-containing protein